MYERNREAMLQGHQACDEFYLEYGDWKADELVHIGILEYTPNPYAEGSEDFNAWHYGWNSCYPERWKEQYNAAE